MNVTNRSTQSGCSRPNDAGSCRRQHRRDQFDTLAEIVEDYKLRHQAGAVREHNHFKNQALEVAIKYAGWAKDDREKRYGHQRRIKRNTLKNWERKLSAKLLEIRACKSFEDLYDLIWRIAEPMYGAGRLLAYDTALRLGANIGLRPDRVYLHAGAKVGAIKLGYPRDSTHIEVKDLPPELLKVLPEEVEDILCIYKDELGKFKV
jgi:hypothetical protein